MLSVVYQGDKEKVLSIMKELSSSMANVNAFTNIFSVNKFAKAKEFLEKQGFIIKEESISKYMDKLKCVPEDKEAILRETLGSKINNYFSQIFQNVLIKIIWHNYFLLKKGHNFII